MPCMWVVLISSGLNIETETVCIEQNRTEQHFISRCVQSTWSQCIVICIQTNNNFIANKHKEKETVWEESKKENIEKNLHSY